MVTIGGLPVFDALVNDEETGMLKISLVDEPAVMTDFLAFDAIRRMQMYAVQDDEKRLVYGVVMRANFPILRRSPGIGEYYIVYKPDTIRKMAEKYLADGFQNRVNVQHSEDVEGVRMVQWFIKDAARGVSPEGFADIADGSLFAEFHVQNDEVWKAVKDGTYNGFSLEGVFDFVPEDDREAAREMAKDTVEEFALQVRKEILSIIQTI